MPEQKKRNQHNQTRRDDLPGGIYEESEEEGKKRKMPQ